GPARAPAPHILFFPQPRCPPALSTPLPQPLPQRHRMHPKIGGDLLDRHPVFAVAGDPDNVVAKFLGIGPCHGDILPARHPGQAISGVTYSCSRPRLSESWLMVPSMHAS